MHGGETWVAWGRSCGRRGSPSDVAPSPPGAVVPQLEPELGLERSLGKCQVSGRALGLRAEVRERPGAPKLPHPRAGRSGPAAAGQGSCGQRQAQSAIPGPRQGEGLQLSFQALPPGPWSRRERQALWQAFG